MKYKIISMHFREMKPNLFVMKSLNKIMITASIFIICSTLFFTGSSCDSDDNGDNTIDNTSHNFVWEIDTLGDYGSYLNDVAIIDENNVWVLGEIKNDGELYGAAIWNGEQWELKKLIAESSNVRPRGIWAFSDDNIWFASGSIYHWDGNNTTLEWIRNIGTDETVEKVWGSSSSDMYFVGSNGSIVHYDGSVFTKMESGTELNLLDVYGNEEKVFATGHSNGHESIALEYDGTQWKTKFFSESLLPGEDSNFLDRFYSVWVHEDTVYIVAKAGIWKESLSTGEGILLSNSKIKITDQVTKRIRGNNYNDFFIADIWGEMIHYNGSTWYLDQTVYSQYPDGQVIIKSMDFKGDFCVAVGYLWNKAFVMRGYRTS